MLVNHVKRDADGLVTEIQYDDYAHTTTAFDYDDLRRLRNLTTFRTNLPQGTPPGTGQMLLQDEQYKYDRVGNPTEIRDWRTGSEWPNGSKPVTRKMQYDDLYRLSRIDYEYAEGVDGWVDPYAAEVLDNTRPQPAPHGDFSDGQRSLWQTWEYDWLGNTSKSDDDAHGFYDRSLGTTTNGVSTAGRYQLEYASNWPGPRPGGAGISGPGYYDAAGNLRSFFVERSYDILPADKCLSEDPCWSYQHFEYEWDEVGRLTRARRWDHDDWQSWDYPDAELRYAYDASDNRVRKSVVDGPTQEQRHTVYIFNSLELRLAEFDGDDYESTAQTEVPYLFGHGVRLARVVHTAPDAGTPSVRVFLELGDHLGSTSVVLDRATGELVQRSTAYAYGAPESHYRPGRWHEFREDYRFTGKEDDVEVGLVYFGKRYLNPQLGRWISPDPLAVHSPGKADLNLYAYVHGRVLSAVDPVGLDDSNLKIATAAAASVLSWAGKADLSKIPNSMLTSPGPTTLPGLLNSDPKPDPAWTMQGAVGLSAISAGRAKYTSHTGATPKPPTFDAAFKQIQARDNARFLARGGIIGVNLLLGYVAAKEDIDKGNYGQAAWDAAPSLAIAGSQIALMARDRKVHGSFFGLSGNSEKATNTALEMLEGTESAAKTSKTWTRIAGVLGDVIGKGLFLVDMMLNLESDNPALTRAMREREAQQKRQVQNQPGNTQSTPPSTQERKE